MSRGSVAVCCMIAIFASAGFAAELTILYTNDLHLRFGRLDAIERLIAAERATGNPLLLLDAGDTFQDFRTPLTAVWGADEMVAWMNRVGYDAMALGNHDMYWGPRRLDALVREASFPVLCSNLSPIRSGAPSVPFVPSARIDVDGYSVLLIGLIAEELLPYTAYPTVRMIPAASAVRREIDRAADPPDLIVVLAHLPVDNAARVAQAVPEIDVFVTGHSHEELSEPRIVGKGKTILVQSGAFGENLGRLVVDVDRETGAAELVSNRLLSTGKAPTDIGRGLLQFLRVAAVVTAAALLALL